MTFNNLDWDELRFFLAAVQSGTYSGAAATLNVDRTTVGRRIKELERRLGASLFEQTATGYQPSEAGRQVLASARAIENELTGLLEALAQEEHEIAGTLRVCVPVGIASELMHEFTCFHESYPRVTLELVEATNVLESIVGRKADVGLCFAPDLPDAIRGIRIACCGVNFYQQRAESEQAAATAKPSKPWITWGNEITEPWMQELSTCHKAPCIKVNSWQAMHTAIQAGLGIGCLLDFMAANDNGLELVPHIKQPMDIDAWLITHNDVPSTERAEVFIDMLLAKLGPRWRR